MVGPVRREDDRQNGGNNRYNPFGITKSSFPQGDGAPRTPGQPKKPKLWDWLIKAMPRNGLYFRERPCVCKKIRRDKSIWFSLEAEFLWAKPKDARVAALEMVNVAVYMATKIKPPADYYEMVNTGNPTAALEASMHFLSALRGAVYFAQEVSPPVFAEFFCEVIKARSAYFAHYEARGWHILPREEHSPLALAVDKFLSVAWFWDDMVPVIAAEGEQYCDEDNEEEKERISYAQHQDVDKSDALGSLFLSFDGLGVWTPEDDDNKYEDDVEPTTDDEEDVVMGGI
ncbi:hypothetical protein QBC45DRAFT_472626 [Copromyces sp. CBS 386.78]|nr:hypothetical protein QBC45DRAFT_472626 [Copromyces sp. CBS 386.78]